MKAIRILLVMLLVMLVALPLVAQQPTPQATQLKLQLAQKDVEIATLNKQIHELQLEVQLYEAASGVAARRQQDQKAVDDAQKAVVTTQEAIGRK